VSLDISVRKPPYNRAHYRPTTVQNEPLFDRIQVT
jgi:hypothetical protein